MRKEDMSVPALLAEAVGIILGVAYIGLQVYYGISFYIGGGRIISNVLAAVLVYAGLTLLSIFPEKINAISPEVCVGKVRIYSIRMVRSTKLIFITGLLIPCICDAAGYDLQSAYSLLVIGMMIVIAVYYEYRILMILKEHHTKK